jgi:hypothetical protein
LRLFALNAEQSKQINRFLRWHIAYLATVAIFFTWVYTTDRFRSSLIWREKFLFLVLAPLSTAIFVLISPWRKEWYNALIDMYLRLEGQGIFCFMAAFVFVFGFFIYSIFIWGLGAIGPALAHM